MKEKTHFRRHLQAARGGLAASSALLFLQAIVTVAWPLTLMLLIDGLLLPAYRINGSLAFDTQPSGFAPTSDIWANLFEQSPLLSRTTDPTAILLTLALTLVALSVLGAFLEFAERVSVTRVAHQVLEGLREDLAARLLTRRQGYLDRKRKSDLVARLSGDAAALEYLIGSGLSAIARGGPSLLLIFVLMTMLNPALALLVFLMLPAAYFLILYFNRGARVNLAKLRSETAHFETEAVRALVSAPVIKSMTLEPFVLRSLHTRLEELGRHMLNLRRADGALAATATGTRQLLRAALLFFGGYLLLKGEMSAGGLAVFLFVVGPLVRSMQSIAQFVSDWGRAETSVDRIESLFDELETESEPQGSQAFISLPFPDATTLRFEGVSFAYPDSPPLLDGFSAAFHAGELIALTGFSGSGRTSFGRLLNRMLDPVQGRIMLGRTDLKRFRLEVLRSYVTVVEHDPYFVTGTVRENLLFGAESDEIREQQISEALHAANAYDFVQSLPEKLETHIGEGGFDLSASQMRRLGLARAFLREQSQIFVFDEPTTGLDPDSAASVVAAIHRLAERGAMVFWITNRLEEIPQADRVVLFSRVPPLRVGTHEELLREDPLYRSYFAPSDVPRANRASPIAPRPEPEA